MAMRSSWNKDQTGLRLIGKLPVLHVPLVFPGKIKKVSPQTWNLCRPHPKHWPPTLPHVPYIAVFPEGGVRGNNFIILLFSEVVPPSWFYFSPAPISWNALQQHVYGLNLVGCFQSLLPHLDLWCGPVVVWASATWILLLCYHSTSATRGPVMTREYMTNRKSNLGQAVKI